MQTGSQVCGGFNLYWVLSYMHDREARSPTWETGIPAFEQLVISKDKVEMEISGKLHTDKDMIPSRPSWSNDQG